MVTNVVLGRTKLYADINILDRIMVREDAAKHHYLHSADRKGVRTPHQFVKWFCKGRYP